MLAETTAADVGSVSLEEELGEEGVSLVGSEVIEQHLWDVARVLEEAEDADKHLDELDGRQLLHAPHVVNAQRHAPLVCNSTTQQHYNVNAWY